MGTQDIRTVQIPNWNTDQRVTSLEQNLQTHINSNELHLPTTGYYTYTYDDTADTETFTIWADSALIVPKFREVTKYNLISEIIYKSQIYYNVQGKAYKKFYYSKYIYEPGIEGRILSYNVQEITS